MCFLMSFLCVSLIQIGYIKKDADGALIYNVVNQDPEAEGTHHHRPTHICFWKFCYQKTVLIFPLASSLKYRT